VLFVSHSLPVLRRLCSRGMFLREGRIVRIGRIDEVISEYLEDIKLADEITFTPPESATAYFTRFCIRDLRENKTTRIPHSEPFVTEIEYVIRRSTSGYYLSWMLARDDGVQILGSGEIDSSQQLALVRKPGKYIATVRFPGGILNEGRYQYRIALGSAIGHFH